MAKSGTNVSFTYDHKGIRLTKTVGNITTRYTYWGNKLLMFNDGTNYGNVRYDDKGQAIALRYKGKEYFFIYNAQGDVVAIAKADGTVVVEYTYDAWGKILTCTGSMASTLGKYNPFRYRGYVYDEETGLYYLNSRYYDPKVGRFICADGYSSTGQGLLGMNTFAYCGNKPSDRKDSNGTFYDAAWGYHSMRQEYAQAGIAYPVNSPNYKDAWSYHQMRQEYAQMGIAYPTEQISGVKDNLHPEDENPNTNYAKVKPNMSPNPNKRKGSEKRQPSGSRERNVGHPNGEEHSRVPKGNRSGSRRFIAVAGLVGASAAIIWIAGNDLSIVGVADDAAIIPLTILWWDYAKTIFS